MFLLVKVGDFLRLQRAEARGFSATLSALQLQTGVLTCRAEWLISDAAAEQERRSLRHNGLITDAFKPQAIKSPISLTTHKVNWVQ
jgi:hypothetical protein